MEKLNIHLHIYLLEQQYIIHYHLDLYEILLYNYN